MDFLLSGSYTGIISASTAIYGRNSELLQNTQKVQELK
jgi:hypothetical protein